MIQKKKKNLNYKSKSLVYEKGNLIKCKTANSTVKKKKKRNAETQNQNDVLANCPSQLGLP